MERREVGSGGRSCRLARLASLDGGDSARLIVRQQNIMSIFPR